MTQKTILKLIGATIGIAGLYIVAIHSSPWVAVGVFLAIAGNNIEAKS